MRILPLVLLLVALPLEAEEADLGIRAQITSPTGPGGSVPLSLLVTNGGPARATATRVIVAPPAGVRATLVEPRCIDTSFGQVRCNLGDMAPDSTERIDLAFAAPSAAGFLTFAAEAVSETPDPDRSNNITSATTEVVTSADLRIYLFLANPRRGDPGQELRWVVEMSNEGPAAAEDVVLQIELPSGTVIGTIDAAGWNCAAVDTSITCTRPLFEASGLETVVVHALAPGLAEGGTVTATATLSASTPDSNPANNEVTSSQSIVRIIRVTTTEDGGEGSLRSAIESANESCGENLYCRIVFDLLSPLENGGWRTIRPLSPLPEVSAGVTIDGRTAEDSNPLGPEIEIDGALAGPAHGLVLTGCESNVRDLTIDGFSGYGILIRPQDGFVCLAPQSLEHNFIGTDPTGTRPRPNGLRGVGAEESGVYYTNIVSNVLSGNARSGLWLERGADILVSDNRIGVAANSDVPLPNGASGIYVGPGTSDIVIAGNVIAFNSNWGIALDESAGRTSIRFNSIRSNFSLGIDYGLDYVTPNAPDDGVLNHPILTAARYDSAAQATVIEGVFEERIFDPVTEGFWIDFYSSVAADDSGFGEGETFLGSVRLASGPFSFIYRGDLRGMAITATATHTKVLGFKRSARASSFRDGVVERTSEFSNAVRVTE